MYEAPEPGEFRILVDRLWPRGVAKDRIDLWLKDVAPSAGVRNAFGHRPENFYAFVRDYRAELAHNPAVEQLREMLAGHPHTALLYGAKDAAQNQAAVLLDFLNGGPATLD